MSHDGGPVSRSAPLRRTVLGLLFASNAINVGFLAFDERMWAPELLTGSALLAGVFAYVVAVPLVWRDRKEGYQLMLVVVPLASIVVVGDNFSVFGSTPNEATYWLNWAFFAAQVPLAGASGLWLRAHGGPGAP
ncbi:MAG TPA: hypothetical protein VGB42_12375 [Candidatus Thermoplasmatota archaeon]